MDKEMKTSKTPPSWHPQQEKILKNWSEIGSSYRYLHDKSFNKYETCNMCFNLPVIILSTLTGVANFAQSSFPVDARPTVSVIIGSLNIIAGLITTIAQFLKVAEKMEGHRSATVAYSKFSRNISVELSLPVPERQVHGTEFLSTQRAELDRLIEQSPNIPEDIVKRFDKTFIKRDVSGNKIDDDDEFYKPEILDIRPVMIYRKTKHELEEEEKLKKINEIKWNKEIKDMIIKDDTKRRVQIEDELINKMKVVQSFKPPEKKIDKTKPDAIVLEMNNIMQELNMNELNDMGYDIENNKLKTPPSKSINTGSDKTEETAPVSEEKKDEVETKQEDVKVIDNVSEIDFSVKKDTPENIIDVSNNDPSGNNVILGKIDIE
tara:strand:- start:703 stop:1833 length:1131 start_codon:yes stop_codon:yes gene_type:complete